MAVDELLVGFDIETAPLEESVIFSTAKPFVRRVYEDPPYKPHGGYGEAANEKRRLEYNSGYRARLDAFVASEEERERKWSAEVLEGATLNSHQSRIMAIGYFRSHPTNGIDPWVDHDLTEAQILERFWDVAQATLVAGGTMVGFNSRTFDLPFILRRSAVHGIPASVPVFNRRGFVEDRFVDVLDMWDMARDPRGRISLASLCRVFGMRKMELPDSLPFWKAYERDKESAIEYCQVDAMRPVELKRILDHSWRSYSV